MKIVRLKTGSTCVTLPDEQVIFVDPVLTREGMAEVIRTALPQVHPDAVGHWIEAAMPSTTPLAVPQPNRRERRAKSGRHAASRVGRAGMQLTSMAAAAALGVVVVPLVQGAGSTPVAAAEAWQNPVFSRMEVGSAWDCQGTDNSDLVATCTTPDGTVMHAEAWVGPNSLTFIFTYRDAKTGLQHRNTLKVFASEGGVQAWIKTSPTDKALLPDLVVGDRWLMYGSDRNRLQQWAERLSEDVVLPADISEVAFKMGLLPAPRRAESNAREMAHVDEMIRKAAARILVGDESLPIPATTPVDVTPGPGGAEEVLAPIQEGPVPGVIPPPPATPAEPPPMPAPPPASPPATGPTPPPTTGTGDEAPVGQPPTDSEPGGQFPGSAPGDETPGADVPGEAPGNGAGDEPGRPMDPVVEPTGPDEPVDDGSTGQPQEGIGGGEPGQGPAQPGDLPAGDPLADPIEVPEDENTPVLDGLVADSAPRHGPTSQRTEGHPGTA
ncbi:H/ACA ribonucleoprotein complex non-core subunit NAF1 [Micromonospora noduli]|nr:H/ACA ribonucleoprotein complex non-core subunit NAF1 [Micromonospora noduli]